MSNKAEVKTENLQKDFDDLRLRNARRADYGLAEFRNSVLGRIYEKFTYGESSTREQVQQAQDIASMGVMKQFAGPLNNTPEVFDDHIGSALKNLKVTSLLYQYYSANYRDDAQNRMIYDLPKWSLGYQWAGPAGLAMSLVVSLNKSTSSEANFMQLQSMNVGMIKDYLGMLNMANSYGMNKSAQWLEAEQMRGASSVDPVVGRARVEFQNMVAPPHALYGKVQNLRMNYEPKFLHETSKYRAEQKRLTGDLMYGINSLGN